MGQVELGGEIRSLELVVVSGSVIGIVDESIGDSFAVVSGEELATSDVSDSMVLKDDVSDVPDVVSDSVEGSVIKVLEVRGGESVVLVVSGSVCIELDENIGVDSVETDVVIGPTDDSVDKILDVRGRESVVLVVSGSVCTELDANVVSGVSDVGSVDGSVLGEVSGVGVVPEMLIVDVSAAEVLENIGEDSAEVDVVIESVVIEVLDDVKGGDCEESGVSVVADCVDSVIGFVSVLEGKALEDDNADSVVTDAVESNT